MNKTFRAIYIFVLFGALSAQAAPVCRSLLLNISDAAIEATIHDLAKMKINLDQSKAQGEQHRSAITKQEAKQFKMKYQEVRRSLESRMTEAELRHAVEEQIAKLQIESKNNLKEESEKEKSRREIEDKELRPVYVKVSAQKISYSGQDFTPLVYLSQKHQAITTIANKENLTDISNDVFVYDLNSGVETPLAPTVKALKVSADEKKILLLSRKHYEIVDLTNLQRISRTELPALEHPPIEFVISPDMSLILLSHVFVDRATGQARTQLNIIDVASGQIVKTISDTDLATPIYLRDSVFLDNQTLLISEEKKLTRLDLTTMKTTAQSFSSDRPKILSHSLSADGSRIVVALDRAFQLEILTLSAVDLSILAHSQIESVMPYAPGVAQDPAHKNRMALFQRDDNQLHLRSMDHPEVVLFDFGNIYNKGQANPLQAVGADFSPDGREILIRSNTKYGQANRQGYLDLWRLKENN